LLAQRRAWHVQNGGGNVLSHNLNNPSDNMGSVINYNINRATGGNITVNDDIRHSDYAHGNNDTSNNIHGTGVPGNGNLGSITSLG
jgi:hypothetical protein